MKKHQLHVIVILLVSIIGLVTTGNAQKQSRQTAAARISGNLAKPASSPSKLADLQKAVSGRRSPGVVSADPCATSVPITVGQPVTAALTADDCLLTASNTHVDFYIFHGTAGQAISVAETSSAFDTYLYLFDDANNVIDENDDSGDGTDSRVPIDAGIITLPYTGDYFIGANSYDLSTGAYTISVNSPAECAPVAVFYNQAPTGTFSASSCAVNIGGDLYYTGLYTFYGVAGKQISLKMASAAFDAYMILHTPSGTDSLDDDDSGGGTDAKIPATGTYTLPETGTYTIEVSSFNSFQTGSYTLTTTGPATGSISGRVVSPSGAGLRSVIVSLTDAQGVKRTATTTSFGFYTFTDVAPGPNYVIRITSRQYRFTSQTMQFNDDLTNVDFSGLE